MHNLQSKFIAERVRNHNYTTTCFGLWRPSSGQEFEYSKVEGGFGWLAVCEGSKEDRDLVLPRHCKRAWMKYIRERGAQFNNNNSIQTKVKYKNTTQNDY
jgi:hypothetical protein